MANELDKTILQLPERTALTGAEAIPFEDADGNGHLTMKTISDEAGFNAFANRWLRLRAIFGPVLFGVDHNNRTFSVSWQNADKASARYFVTDLSLGEARRIAELIVPPVLGYAEFSCAGRVSLPPVSYHQGSGPKFYAADTNILQYNSTIEVCLLAPQSSG